MFMVNEYDSMYSISYGWPIGVRGNGLEFFVKGQAIDFLNFYYYFLDHHVIPRI